MRQLRIANEIVRVVFFLLTCELPHIMSASRKKYLLENVFPEAVKAGRFGEGFKFLRCETNDGKVGDHFASSVVFINAILRSVENNSESSFGLVLKFLPENVKVREIMNSKVQFSNEIVMYSEVLPNLDFKNITQNVFPTYYWGNNSNEGDKEPIVIIEDLGNKGFSLSKQRVFLEYNHVVLALQALGKFHALSYIMKQKNPTEFNKMKDKLTEFMWDQEDDDNIYCKIIGPSALRGVNALLQIQNNEILESVQKKLQSSAFGLMKYLVTPEEPTAVICHGDFCNHNMLFNYTSDVPTSVKFIDLQTSRYASPVIDLSMLLLLNVDPELRLRHWDEFISLYYNSVKETVLSAECVPPSFDLLQLDLKNKLFYGYFHCSYFLPILLSGEQLNVDESVDLEHQLIVQQMLQFGGEKGTQSLVKILELLQERNYFGFLDS